MLDRNMNRRLHDAGDVHVAESRVERMCMDQQIRGRIAFGHIPLNLRRRSGSLGPYVIANRAHTHGFRSILRDVRKLKD
jgi:hypothetical protein